MKKNLLSFYFILISLSVSNVVFAQRSTMYVSGRHLYSAASEKVILRGINEMYYALDDKTGFDVTNEMEKTGANTIRISWFVEFNNDAAAVANLDNAVNNCIQKKMIPIVTLIDATGKFEKLQFCIDFWKKPNVIALVNKHKKWFVLNIANEAGNVVTDEEYKLKYKNAIGQLRDVGVEVPLLIDGAGFGADVEQIIRCAAEIIQSDRLNNIFFSCHTYWNSNHETRLKNAIASIINNNLPIIFGEAPTPTSYNEGTAASPNCKPSPYNYFLQKFNENEIGWLAWSWGKVQNNDCRPTNGRSLFDITVDGKFGNWLPGNQWAIDVTIGSPYSIQKTSVRPPSFFGSTSGPNKAEAENGTNTGVTNASIISGFSGSGYVNGPSFDNAGDIIKLGLNVNGAGAYNLNVRYNGRFGEKYQDLFVNGNFISTVQFPATSTWSTKVMPNINLTAGNNTIEIRKNWGWMDVDFVEATSSNINTNIKLEAESGTLNGVTTSNSITSFSGNGYVEATSLNDQGDFIKVFPQVNTQGSYKVDIRYNGRFGEKYQSIYINNVLYGSVQFPASNTWATKTINNVYLNAGVNTIELRKDWGWMDVDYFEINNAAISRNLQVNNNVNKKQILENNSASINIIEGNKIVIDDIVIVKEGETAVATLYTIEGKLLQQWNVNTNQKVYNLNKTLTAGIYVVQIIGKKYQFSKKLVVQ